MSHKNILSQAWEILKHYRALWVFGFLLALTATSYNSQSNWNTNSPDDNGRPIQIEPGENFQEEWNRVKEEIQDEFEWSFERNGFDKDDRQLVLNAIYIAAGMIVALSIAGAFLRYISETALIKMVDEYEASGEKVSVRQGFRWGWSKQSWRLFLIDLLILGPLFLAFLSIVGVGVYRMFNYAWTGNEIGPAQALPWVGAFLILAFVAMIVSLVYNFVIQLVRRETVIEDLGVIDSIKSGMALVRNNFKDVGLMWLIMLGISIAWPIVLIPFIIVFVLIGGLLGFGIVLAFGGIVGAFTGSMGGIISTVIVGLTILTVFVFLPLAWVTGYKMTYQSTVWTLTHREVKSLGALDAETPPALDEAAAA